MNVYLSNIWTQLKASFWLLPALMVLAMVGFSFITLNWDRALALDHESVFTHSTWQGGADGARQLLSTIAGSIITITGVVFSMTIVTLALASAQYGPGLLRNFMRDLGTQLVLGTFISTSLYAILILRTVRTGQNSFVPNLSTTISVGLAILSLSMLIYFIHHLSIRVQATDIIARVSHELTNMIETSMQPNSFKRETREDSNEKECTNAIISSKIGYLQAINYEHLVGITKKHPFIIEIHVRPGHFLNKEAILAKINIPHLSEKIKKSIYKAFIIGKERNATQDIEYAIDQLVSIALRALGKSSNDTLTANSCIDHLGAALCLICQKDLSLPYYDKNGYVRVVTQPVTFEGLVDASFNQIRQYGSSNPSILIHILETLRSILSCTHAQDQREALKKHVVMIQNSGHQFPENQDRLDLQERVTEFNSEFQKLTQ